MQVEAGILARTIQIVCTADPTVEMALVNHKKLKIDEVDAAEKDGDKAADLSKKSLHDLSQVSKYSYTLLIFLRGNLIQGSLVLFRLCSL